MKNILTIIKKELRRVFLDRKLIFSIIVLPGILMVGIFGVMGFVANIQDSDTEDREVNVYVYNFPGYDNLQGLLDNLGIDAENILRTQGINISISSLTFEPLDNWNQVELNQKVISGEIPLAIRFSETFINDIEALYNDTTASVNPQVTILRNTTDNDSNFAFTRLNNMLSVITQTISNQHFDGPIIQIQDVPLADETTIMAGIFASIFPMMIIISIISAIISVTPEMIAGEKERGSLPILLVTKTKRSHLAIAKIIGASIITIASVASTTIGTFFGFQIFLSSVADGGFAFENVYGVADYAKMLLIFTVTTLSLTGMFSLLSAFARNTKEAMSYSSALMIIAMVIPFIIGQLNLPDASWVYLIPVVNSTLVVIDIFMFEVSMMPMLITIISNLVLAVAIAFALTRMFESEKIMFNK